MGRGGGLDAETPDRQREELRVSGMVTLLEMSGCRQRILPKKPASRWARQILQMAGLPCSEARPPPLTARVSSGRRRKRVW